MAVWVDRRIVDELIKLMSKPETVGIAQTILDNNPHWKLAVSQAGMCQLAFTHRRFLCESCTHSYIDDEKDFCSCLHPSLDEEKVVTTIIRVSGVEYHAALSWCPERRW
jgi:hypothetical protein